MMLKKSEKAFDYEQGQYICHIFCTISDDDVDTLNLFADEIGRKEDIRRTPKSWRHIDSNDDRGEKNETFHVTLLRGHRAVHYHQIRSLVERIRSECKNLQPFLLLLDQIRIFSNLEKTKEFLCLTHDESVHNESLMELKRVFRTVIDQFADRLTEEDDNENTFAHCSLMYREYKQGPKDGQEALKDIDLLEEDCPSCLIQVKKVFVKIGKKIYDIDLGISS